ncbi:hypothetical protein HGRIS_013309 [Hohenbuehelia grisea]|uniref:Transposase n=1 Tax=Hohenbuehelia grisea TaxID=104357 RepID=A0ABR3IV37_9AGAR
MGRSTSARRSPQRKEERLARRKASPKYEQVMQRLEETTLNEDVNNFDDFSTRMRADAARLRAALVQRYPGLDPATLPLFSRLKRILLREPQAEVASPYLLMRFNNIVSKSTAQRLLNCYVEMDRLGIKFSHSEKNWSTSSALHAGVWSLYQKRPYTTRDTRMQSPEVEVILARMLGIIGKEIAPKLARLLREHCLNQWLRLQRYANAQHPDLA